jgi:hypothetical protein
MSVETFKLFPHSRRDGWSQWGDEDVEQNTTNNVAHREGHVEPQLRLLEIAQGLPRRPAQE